MNLGLLQIAIAVINVLKGLSPRRKIKCARESKKYRCLPRSAGTFVPDWPNLSICSLGEGRSTIGPAPTRFSEAHAAPDITGIMEQRG